MSHFGQGNDGCPEWYAVFTRSRHEFKVDHRLSDKQFETFLPVVKSLRRWKDRKKFIERPLFSGYLFLRCQMDNEKYLEILKTSGVVRILGNNKKELSPISDEEIKSIRILTENKATINHCPYVKEGEMVEIVNGPLTGAKGILIRRELYKSTVVVSVHLLGRSISVEVDSCDMMAC
ncbi:MAG: UpxY family transcription antiterminator [Candidatus Aminicenantes bacterium]|nr:UpxY family transcription antiterminator [Candidatus Aminicenantes bacterium]